MLKAFSALMALMLVAGFAIGVGSPARAKQAASSGTVISNTSGNPVAEISVDSITDPFEGYDASSGPQRGFRFVMVTVTITNTGDQPYQGYSYGLSLIDQDGFLATPTYVYRTDMSVPDLVTDPIDPGASITGALFYQVLSDAEIASVVFQPDYSQFYLLASNGDVPEAGAPVTILGEEGGEAGSVTVSDITDPYTEVDPGYGAPRGYHYVAATITFENTSSRPISIDPSAFMLVDDQGFASGAAGAYRGDAPEVPDLAYADLAPGDTVTGIVTYQVFNEAAPSRIIYSSGGTQLVTLAVLDTETTVPAISDIPAGAAATPGAGNAGATEVAGATEEATAIAEETGDCVGLRDWLTRIDDRSAQLDTFDISVDTVEDLQNADVDTLNSYVDALESMVSEQEGDAPPAIAEDLGNAYVDYLNLQLDALNDVIDAKDAGKDLQPIFDDYQTQLTDSSTALLDEYSKVADACPASVA
jgi:Domain of unknown function (DUF4352)